MKYLKNIFTTGATGKTPARILKAIAQQLPVTAPHHIIELGAGMGEITAAVVRKYQGHKLVYEAFEINAGFARNLQTAYPDLIIHTHDALRFSQVSSTPANLIICSLPLSFFPANARKALLQQMKEQLAPGGSIIILFHAIWLLKEMKRVFPRYHINWFRHLPPYLLLTYTANNS